MPSVFVPVVDTAYLAFQMAQANGEFAQNGLWVQRDEAWDATKLLALCDHAITAWGDNVKPLTSDNYSLVQVAARDFTTETSPSVSSNTGLPLAGTESSGSISQGEAFAISLRTGLAGRSFRGRWYFMGFPAAFFDDATTNVLNSGHASDMASALQALVTAINGSDAGHNKAVIVSRYSKAENPVAPFNRATGVITPIIGTGFHDLFMDFQRRRGPGHNRHH